MIWSLFSLFMFFVFAGEGILEPIGTQTPVGNSDQETMEVKRSTQPEEDCRYQDGPIPQRDLSDYVVDSDRKLEPSNKKELEQEEIEQSLEAEETQNVQEERNQAPLSRKEENQ